MSLSLTRRTKVVSVFLVLFLFTSSVNSEAFNWDTDIAPIWLIAPYEIPAIQATANAPGDAPVIIRITTILANAWFDAIAPYHPTARGVYSDLGRRPPAEYATNKNKNIAIMYASFRVLNFLLPENAADWRKMMTSAGLNPDNNSKDLTTPIGIGNVAGAAIAAARANDGMNQLGNEGGKKYFRKRYADYTGYQPVNSAFELVDPSRWQPLVVTRGTGGFQIQTYSNPQWALTLPYTFTDPNQFQADGPPTTVPGSVEYISAVNGIVATQAALTDRQKVVAELFDDKVQSLGVLPVFINILRGYSLDKYVYERFFTGMAIFDGGIVTWNEKNRYDAVRPTSAVRYTFGNQLISGWGGPGKGTVHDLPANEWRSYLNTADHPEYPSGTSCFCSAHAQAARRLEGGSDQLNLLWAYTPGSSRIEPGVTPKDTVWLYWSTWTEWLNDCKLSRYWGGVHFLETQLETAELCQPIGDMAYEYGMKLVNGIK